MKLPKLLATGLIFAGVTGNARCAITMRIVADNDFAVFVGNSTNITRLIYQNPVDWGVQATRGPFEVGFMAGESHVYLLGMGGGGAENMAGRVNGFDLTAIPGIRQSTNIASSLTGYNGSQVASGVFSVGFADVFAGIGTAGWLDPAISTAGVSNDSFPGYSAFQFGTLQAVAYRFSGASVGELSAVPEPAGVLATGVLLGAGLLLRRRERKSGEKIAA